MSQDLEQVKDILRSQVATIAFSKSNGEKRIMECTLNLIDIPESLHPKGTSSQVKTDQVRVFDSIVQGWRSFNFKNLESIDFLGSDGKKQRLTFNVETAHDNS